MTFPIFPTQASRIAAHVDHLYFALLCISAVVMTVVFLPMTVFLFKYRRGRPANRKHPNLPTLKIETKWSLVSFIIMLAFFAWGARIYYDIEVPPTDAMIVNVVGKQWMWKIQHLEGNREINELHVPVGRNVKLILASQDVIHSFFMPAFRVKQDVVPGWYRTIWFNADKTGVFHLFCAEMCGAHHSAMVGKIVVMTQADYQNWLIHGQPSSTLAQSGEKLFRELGCSGCHVNSSIVRAPPLFGLFGKPVPLNGGQIVVADESYIRDSILLPAKDIAAGYTNDMPSYQGRINEEQLMEVVSYIRSIGDIAPQTPRTLNSP